MTRVAAYGLLLDDRDRLLLCRLSKGERWSGFWTLPGGGLEFGEDPRDAAIREVMEETGLVAEVVSLAGVESFVKGDDSAPDGPPAFQAIQIVYRMQATGGSLRDEVDGATDSAAWFSRVELEALPMVALAQAGAQLAFGITTEEARG